MILSKSKQLEDKGWAQMNALLEKEMPRSQKRRPLLWWWAASLVGISVLTGAFKHYSGRNSPSTATLENGEYVVQTTPKSAESAISSPQPSTLHSVGSTKEMLEVASAQTITKAHSVPAKPHFSAKNIPTMDVQSLQLSAGTIGSDIVVPEVLPVAALSMLAGAVPSPVHHQQVRDVQMHQIAAQPVVKKVPHKSVSSRFELGLMAGANMFQVKQVPGFIGGLTLGYASKNKTSGIQTGLVYRYQMFSGESRPVIPVSYDRYLAATGNDEITPDNLPGSWIYISKTNRVLVPVMKSHQLEIPVLLFWQPYQRFRVYGGTTFMRHIWIESAGTGLFTYNLKVVTTPDADAAGNLNTVIKDQLPTWENTWQTGVGFKPFKHIEIGLFYRSAWYGKSALSDVKALFDNCVTCSAKYPAAARQTRQSIRPQSVQLNISYKF